MGWGLIGGIRLAFFGVDGIDGVIVAGFGSRWHGLACVGMDWLGLARLGSASLRLAWLPSGWVGLAGQIRLALGRWLTNMKFVG